ncbi:hypothetical protein BDP27DRAFT_1313759 [Rhodocollybia butyracea]|uniref:3beta-hydroxysteroid 3-dehydrogenase n=1 Tax=Rhodocollybia butyracea TaxID=206335 RepID=A0A9P5Q8N7_9AGAR|nr:hypothetical protein BDP27DRAFT_1313759 [Rhodocollybia butyracea]
MSWPIIVVTGANSGVGFGICQRLLCQLSERTPSDTLIKPLELPGNSYNEIHKADQFELPCEGITLIMACRSIQRAEIARTKLLQILDKHIEMLRNAPNYDGHAASFRRNVKIAIHSIDLSSLKSIPKFVQELQNRYPYISHLICNAGIAPFNGMNWPACFYQLFTSPMSALTTPRFYTQSWGELSQDGYGFVWQCNVFGHYTLYKDLHPLLASPKYPYHSRVIWTSSLESKRTSKKTHDPYGSSKYQTELISMELEQRALNNSNGSKRVRHFTAHPGVTHTNIDMNLIAPALHYLKHLAFYLARWIGSPNHPITLDKGAVSVVWLCIVSLSSLAVFSSNGNALKFAAQTDWLGNPRVGIAEVEGEQHLDEAKIMVDNFEKLYHEIQESRS